MKNGNLLTTGACLVLICSLGCVEKKHPSPPTSASSTRSSAPTKDISNDLAAAQTEGIVEAFNRTGVLKPMRGSAGTLFCQGVSAQTLTLLSERLRSEHLKWSTDLEMLDLDRWVDKSTGKRAICVRLEGVSDDPQAPDVRIIIRPGKTGGYICRVGMKKSDLGWTVTRWDIIIGD